MGKSVLIKQFKNKAKEPVAGLTPEHAVYDANGVRLDAKLGNVNLQEFRDLQQQCVNKIKEQQNASETYINNKVQSAKAEIDRKHEETAQLSQASLVGTTNTTGLSGNNVQENLNNAGTKLSELETEVIYDVTANNDGATFASLSALLSSESLSTLIPISVRNGGMSIRFIQSSDNKYVQYRLMSDTFNTTVANWQGVDDEPTAGSDNLVKSGGVADKLAKLDEEIAFSYEETTWGTSIKSYKKDFIKGHLYRIDITNSGDTEISIRLAKASGGGGVNVTQHIGSVLAGEGKHFFFECNNEDSTYIWFYTNDGTEQSPVLRRWDATLMSGKIVRVYKNEERIDDIEKNIPNVEKDILNVEKEVGEQKTLIEEINNKVGENREEIELTSNSLEFAKFTRNITTWGADFGSHAYTFEKGKRYFLKVDNTGDIDISVRLSKAAASGANVTQTLDSVTAGTSKTIDFVCNNEDSTYIWFYTNGGSEENQYNKIYTAYFSTALAIDNIRKELSTNSERVVIIEEEVGKQTLFSKEVESTTGTNFNAHPYKFISGLKYTLKLNNNSTAPIDVKLAKSSSASAYITQNLRKVEAGEAATLEFICDNDSSTYLWFYISSSGDYKISYNATLISGLSGEIESLKEGLSQINSNIDTIPSYYKDYIVEKENHINNSFLNKSGVNDIFVFCTDLHNGTNANNTGILIDHIAANTPLKKVFFGGDICGINVSENDLKDSIQSYTKIVGKASSLCDVYQTHGNHDFYSRYNDVTTQYPSSAVYNYFFAKSPSSIVKNEEDLSGVYFYADNKASRIRYIVLDTNYGGVGSNYTIGETQYKWIAEKALGELPANYNVVVMSHIGLVYATSADEHTYYADILELLEAFQNNTSVTNHGKTYDFASNQSKILVCLCGHFHHDLQTYQNGILHVSIACDALYQDYQKSPLFPSNAPRKKLDTINEQTFDVVCSYGSTAMDFFRIGAGYDRRYNIEAKEVSVGGSVTLTTSLTNATWRSFDGSGMVVDGTTWIWTLPNTKVAVTNGVVQGLSSGDAVVYAEDAEHNKEFFYVKVM